MTANKIPLSPQPFKNGAFPENFVKNFDRMSKERSYELATLHAPKAGTWLIFWYNINPETGKLERIRKTFNLNRIKDIKERRAAAAGYMDALNKALKSGWNFFIHEKPPEPEKLRSVLLRALDAHLVGLGKESVRSYKSILNVFLTWADGEGLAGAPVADFTPLHWDKYRLTRANLSAKGQNAHLVLIRNLFSRVQKIFRLIKENPLTDFELLPEGESERYQAFTKQELQQIAALLRVEHPGFYLFCSFVFYAYIRPGHLNFLQRWQIDFEHDLLTIRASTTKSGRNATKQLLAPLKALLLAAGVDRLPADHFIFSDGFLPGERFWSNAKNRADKVWTRYVKKGLGIDKNLYALKHTSGQMMISDNQGIDSSWLQAQMEHSSLSETEAYISKRTVKKIDESRVNLPKF